MNFIDLKFPLEVIDALFPSMGEEGQDVKTTPASVAHACTALGVPEGTELQWHLPDVFSVRYGSSYVATARHGDLAVRFHSTEGEFREGDDKM